MILSTRDVPSCARMEADDHSYEGSIAAMHGIATRLQSHIEECHRKANPEGVDAVAEFAEDMRDLQAIKCLCDRLASRV